MKKIAAMTVFCNEDFRIENWVDFYNEYKDEIDYHIIVNNGNEADNALLQKSFPYSVVLYSSGKNLLRAYNVGLKYIYDHFKVDAVMQITNDIRFEKGAITKLQEKLFSDSSLALIGPVVLEKDSTKVESYGYKTYGYWGPQIPINCGKDYSELTAEFQYVNFVPAGVIMIKTDVWERIGYQDERLEMYCDEWDMFIRFDKIGFKEGVLSSAKAWHQHISRPNAKNSRSFDAFYKSARNHIYITRKHCGFFLAFLDYFFSFVFYSILLIYHMMKFDKQKMEIDFISFKGISNGLHYL